MKGVKKIKGKGDNSSSERQAAPRARSVAHRPVFIRAVLISAVNYMGICASITTFCLFIAEPTEKATRFLVVCLIFTAVTWLIGFFKRRTTHCPLCKGTPLINSGALAHQKAVKFFPFNHGVTATLSILLTQKFRCMYCGTLFDLFKAPSHGLEKPKG